ncbi:hypothetical protein FSP39_009766 [Pinctada imbricata]|uniref:EF-hand domain-containing protein n=1 Tax=Pinctada imbricata TaxID=66713 RepID=A0AA89BWY1_PINIB|nr:hypothetical protein FSP39_009766 [Pinctada imbricata]
MSFVINEHKYKIETLHNTVQNKQYTNRHPKTTSENTHTNRHPKTTSENAHAKKKCTQSEQTQHEPVMIAHKRKETSVNIMARATSFFDPNAPDVVLRSLYMKYDKDGSGSLDKNELSSLFKDDLGLTDSQVEAYCLLLDKDGDAKISFDELVSWLKSGERFENLKDKSRYNRLQKAVAMFKKYDKDGNNSLDRNEFKNLFLDVGGKPEKFDAALAQMDRDGNGVIAFQEFLKWLNWIPLDDI